MSYRYDRVRSLRRRKRLRRLWGAVVVDAIRESRERGGVILKELRCPGCDKKIAEGDANGVIAGRFRCGRCKSEFEIRLQSDLRSEIIIISSPKQELLRKPTLVSN